MNYKFLKPYAIFLVAYGIICLMAFFQSVNFLYVMLVFNTFLATLPMVFIVISLDLKKKNKKVKQIIFLLLWLLFFPNALYMITDFIHITGNQLIYYREVSPYEIGGGTMYSLELMGWLKLLVIGLGAFYATLIGIESFDLVIKSYKSKGKIIQAIIVIITSLLAGIAVYIGRFLRFNSWDVLNPIRLSTKILEAMDGFSVSFSVVFALYILGIYGIYGLLNQIKQD